jgi:hypothetical protein
LKEKLVSFSGVGRRLQVTHVLPPACQLNAHIRSLNPGAIFDQKVAEGHCPADLERGLCVFVGLPDAFSQGIERALDAFPIKARLLGAGYSFAGWRRHPFAVGAGRLDISLSLQQGDDSGGIAAGDFEGPG